jgi:hypothetical protein
MTYAMVDIYCAGTVTLIRRRDFSGRGANSRMPSCGDLGARLMLSLGVVQVLGEVVTGDTPGRVWLLAPTCTGETTDDHGHDEPSGLCREDPRC